LGADNSVSFMFDHVGEIVYPATAASAERMFEAGVEAGAENVESDADGHRVVCQSGDLNAVRDALERDFGPPASAKLVWKPKSATAVEGAAAEALMKLLETLEDSDDVQNVYANFDISDEAMARLSA
jgi:transcriptional/translational regulatory protein YebC/TACO1